jgi:hypothetical protein
MLKRNILSVAILCVMLAMPLFSASAEKPEVYYGPVEDFAVYDCGDFDLVFGYDGWERIIVDWEALRATWQAHTQYHIYRHDDPENEITTNWNNWLSVFRIGKEKGEMRVGTYDLWVIPGIGPLSIDAGRVAWDNDGNIISSGGHYAVKGGLELVCPLFAE